MRTMQAFECPPSSRVVGYTLKEQGRCGRVREGRPSRCVAEGVVILTPSAISISQPLNSFFASTGAFESRWNMSFHRPHPLFFTTTTLQWPPMALLLGRFNSMCFTFLRVTAKSFLPFENAFMQSKCISNNPFYKTHFTKTSLRKWFSQNDFTIHNGFVVC